jgi:hypothetical protein
MTSPRESHVPTTANTFLPHFLSQWDVPVAQRPARPRRGWSPTPPSGYKRRKGNPDDLRLHTIVDFGWVKATKLL